MSLMSVIIGSIALGLSLGMFIVGLLVDKNIWIVSACFLIAAAICFR